MSTKTLDRCLCCKSVNLSKYLNLGNQPLPNFFRKPEQTQSQKFPLEIQICKECYHSQVLHAVDPELLFSQYPYRTGVSATLCSHYAKLAESAIQFARLNCDHPTVLDIGCNDGTLLNYFKDAGFKTYGVDPSPVPTHKIDWMQLGYWNQETYDKLVKNTGIEKFEIITATNVLAHNDNPWQFLCTCHHAMANKGIMVLEFPYALSLFKLCEFDTMYHEHLSYFLVNGLVHLLQDTGLYIEWIQSNDVHGGSLRVFLRKCEIGKERTCHCEKVNWMIDKEREHSLLSLAYYEEFQIRVNEKCKTLFSLIHPFDEVFIFGASAKSTVLMNYISSHQFLTAYDETTQKLGCTIPGTNILVRHPSDIQLFANQDNAFLIMAWNCYDECKKKIGMYLNSSAYKVADKTTKHALIRFAPEMGIEFITI